MNPAIAYTAASASLLTVAVILAMARIQPRAIASRVTSATWLNMPRAPFVTVLGALLGASALSAAQVPFSQTTQIEQSNLTRLLALAPLPAAPAPRAPDNAIPQPSPEPSAAKDRALANLRDYATKIRGKQHVIAELDVTAASTGADAPLPDVETMIERLAARLKAEPNNPDGWGMLGWSYVNTGKYTEAVQAYETALKLDPQNADLKSAHAVAAAKLSGKHDTGKPEVATSAKMSGDGMTGDGKPLPDAPEANSADQSAMIRGMVDGLAARLDNNPNDADGWLRLMKSRTVLGQMGLAKDAMRRALAVFSNDKPVRDRIADAAKDFGLSAY